MICDTLECCLVKHDLRYIGMLPRQARKLWKCQTDCGNSKSHHVMVVADIARLRLVNMAVGVALISAWRWAVRSVGELMVCYILGLSNEVDRYLNSP